MTLGVEMTAGEHHAQYEIPVCLFPPQYSEQEMARAGFQKELHKAEEQSRTSRAGTASNGISGKATEI